MATVLTSTSAAPWRPDLDVFAAADVVPTALILQTATIAGEIEGDAPSVRVAFVDDADAEFVAEGDEIPEADPKLAEVTVYTGKISQLIRISREQFVQRGTSPQLAASVGRAIVKRADAAYLNQPAPDAGQVTPPAGILEHPGIITVATPISDNLDALTELVSILESAGGTPTAIVMNPLSWGQLRTLKVGEGRNDTLLGAGTTDSPRLLLGLPVLVNPNITPGRGAVLNRTAIAAAAGPVQIAKSEHVYFRNDSVGLRATWRIGWNLVHPDRIGAFTVSTPGQLSAPPTKPPAEPTPTKAPRTTRTPETPPAAS